MTRRLRRKLFIGIAATAVLAGATAAVVMAAQPSAAGHAQRAHRHRRGTLATAAAYLGLGEAQLRSELQAGKSLGQIANATPGKSEAGLIQTLEAADRQRLAAASAKLARVVAAEVSQAGGPHGALTGDARRGGRRAGRQGRTLAAAARYLGVSTAQLRDDLRSGETLAQVADATSGKSEAGLTEALVTAAKTAIAARVESGKLTQAQANEILPRLVSRVSAEVKRARRHAARNASTPKAPTPSTG
ncbi:MAG: hypothetical protein JWN10_2840 [Solirubrobacterales bacterium]|nr:hypothetical protein [Solirubrobacterales bacterium]